MEQKAEGRRQKADEAPADRLRAVAEKARERAEAARDALLEKIPDDGIPCEELEEGASDDELVALAALLESGAVSRALRAQMRVYLRKDPLPAPGARLARERKE